MQVSGTRVRRRLVAAAVLVSLSSACAQDAAGTPSASSTVPPSPERTTAPPSSSTTPRPAASLFKGVDPCTLGDPATLAALGLTPRPRRDVGAGVTQCEFTRGADTSLVGILLDPVRPYDSYATPSGTTSVVESEVDGRRTAALTSTRATRCIVAVDFGGTDTLAAASDVVDATTEQNCVDARQLARYAAERVPIR